MNVQSVAALVLLSVSFVAAGETKYLVADLGKLNGAVNSQAQGINDSGQIVGVSSDSNTSRAIYWSDGNSVPTELLTPPGSTSLRAQKIDDSGRIVGIVTDGSGSALPYVWSNSAAVPTPIKVPAIAGINYANPAGFNNQGNIAGYIRTNTVDYRAYFWSDNTTDPIQLSFPSSATEVFALGLNDSGKIVGAYVTPNGTFACYWSSASALPNTLPAVVGHSTSVANDISKSGIIVGNLNTDGNNVYACIWANVDSTPVDLNTLIDPSSNWVLIDASGINESGQIVGTGNIKGEQHAYILTPYTPPLAPGVTIRGKKKVITHQSNYVVHGSATGAVTSITYKMGKKIRIAKGTTSWKFIAKLKSGKNNILVSSHGPGGSSPVIKLTITRS